MARQRLTRKEIKQPDQFISYTVRSLDWAKAHLHHILYGAVGVLVVIGLLIAWNTWRGKRLQKAEALLYQTVKLLDADEKATTGTTEKTDRTANREHAMQQLLNITRNYGGTQAGALAYWYLGHLYFEREDYAAALAAYEQARRGIRDGDQQLMTELVTLSMGYVQEASGDCTQALSSFDGVLQSSVSWLHGEAYLGMGRCYEATRAPDKALAIYERALSDADVGGAVRQSVEERQIRLQRQTGVGAKPSATKGGAEGNEKK